MKVPGEDSVVPWNVCRQFEGLLCRSSRNLLRRTSVVEMKRGKSSLDNILRSQRHQRVKRQQPMLPRTLIVLGQRSPWT